MSSHLNYLGAKKCCATNLARTVIGPQGPQGAGGPIGPYGQQGPTGTQGPRGATGACCRGPQGATGAPGPAGGAQGSTGSTGPQGYQGETGSTGPQGYQGSTGSTGPQGYQGSTGAGGALGYWGSFWSTQTQLNSGPSTPKAMTLNNTDPDSNGVSVVANSRITFSNAGVYNIQFSAQIQDTTSGGGGSQIIEIWFSKNGSPIPDSNTSLTTDNQNSFVVASWNFMLKLNAGDYVEIIWYSTDTGIQLSAVSPVTPGPDIPSVIVTAQQVMYTQVGATGPQGVTGPQGATGFSQWSSMNGLGYTGNGYTGIGVTGQDVLIYGNLLVTGNIDPKTLILSDQNNNISSMSLDYLGNISSTGNITIDPSLNLIVKSKTYQELNSYNGYYGLAKDAYPILNPRSQTLFKSLTTFTPVSTGSTTRFQGICWSPELQLIVACGAFTGSSQQIVTSPNGITWTARNTTAGYTYRSVVWSPQLSLFVAVGGAGNNSDQSGLQRIITSNDGITWTARTSPTDNLWRWVCWSAPLNRFVAVSPQFATGGVGADIRAMYSNDGITWVSSNIPLDVWSAVGWVDELGLFIATGTNNIATSVDGINWVLRSVPLSSGFQSFSWSNELGLAVVSSSTGVIITSPDGINWTQRTTPVALTGANLSGNVWNSQLGVFLLTSVNSAFLAYSKDGINWTSNAYSGGGINICWCPELSIYCYISGGDLAGGGTRGAISALNARIPTALNVFDNSFNNIDQNGNWTLKCKELSSNDSNVSVGSTSGNTEIKCNATGVGGTISLTGGTGLLANSAGVASTNYLTLTINGTPYKIALLNNT